MRLPLLLNGRPPFVKWGATVPLVRGEWEIELIGVIDSNVALWSDRAPTHLNLDQPVIKVAGGRLVRVLITRPGTEEHISVYARKVA